MQRAIDRRQFFLRGAALASTAGLGSTALWAAEPPMRALEAAPGCWYVQGLSELGSRDNQNFISNAGFIVTSESVVVIDALGSPRLAERLLAEIARVTPRKVSHVVLTHYHADHIYGLQVFEKAGAQIIAHEGAREYLHSDTARLRLQASRDELTPWIDEQTRLVPATRWIKAREELTVGDTRLVLQPVGAAHTPEDLVVHVPKARLLYAGDLVFRSRIPFVGQADSRNWIVSLERLLEFDARVIVPGHGPVSTEARQDIQLTRDYLIHLRQAMGEAARDMTPFDEAYEAADWSRFEHLPLFNAANRMNAYNTYLLMEHESP